VTSSDASASATAPGGAAATQAAPTSGGDPGAQAEAALVDRLFEATIGTLELFSVYLGSRLGLYATLADGRARTAPELARDAGIAPRYAREWLEQQAVAGFLEVDDTAKGPDDRAYTLPPAHANVVAAVEHPSYVAPFAPMLAGIASALPAVVEAYRTGEGVPFAAYGPDLRDGQGAINRPAFVHDLASSWIPAAPDVHERLQAGPPARVVEVGCGQGWASIALAAAYPNAQVVGIDLDEASIADARANAAAQGMAGRVRFECGDAASIAADGPVDLVFMVEVLHDVGRPVEVLAAVRTLLAPGGSVIVVDERVADTFQAPGDPIERMMYGWSITHCLPAGISDQPSHGTGTVLRPDAVRAFAREAGFADVEMLPVENDLFRFYRLRA
jgi:2-polyprenyl-3-methyl-5-hydroxy-6-metoxy-1,4-benzoquinol methylase